MITSCHFWPRTDPTLLFGLNECLAIWANDKFDGLLVCKSVGLLVCIRFFFICAYGRCKFRRGLDGSRIRETIEIKWGIGFNFLRRRSISYRNQSIDLQSKSKDWFLYDRHLRLKELNEKVYCENTFAKFRERFAISFSVFATRNARPFLLTHFWPMFHLRENQVVGFY